MKAMILAAGRGERMRPLTDTCPKPLLEAGGKPLIAWHLERLAQAGFRDIVINHAWLGGRIEAALGDGSAYGVRIAYSPEGEALETAGGIANAIPLLEEADESPFLVVNGDVYCEFDYTRIAADARRMRDHGDAAWLVLVPNPPQHPEGDFVLRDFRVRDESGPRLTFSGIGLYRPDLFAGVERGGKARLAPLLRAAMAEDRVGGEAFTGRWEDVGTPERLAALDLELNARRS